MKSIWISQNLTDHLFSPYSIFSIESMVPVSLHLSHLIKIIDHLTMTALNDDSKDMLICKIWSRQNCISLVRPTPSGKLPPKPTFSSSSKNLNITLYSVHTLPYPYPLRYQPQPLASKVSPYVFPPLPKKQSRWRIAHFNSLFTHQTTLASGALDLTMH